MYNVIHVENMGITQSRDCKRETAEIKKPPRPRPTGMWCSHCKKTNHNDSNCRKKKQNSKFNRPKEDGAAKSVKGADEDHSFAFTLNHDARHAVKHQAALLLVDCGAIAHIVKDEFLFVKYDVTFKAKEHVIECADRSRANNVALKRGDAVVTLMDTNGRDCKVKQTNALYMPSYPQNIFSVRAATDKGATVAFEPGRAHMTAPDGTQFKIVQRERLYYFANAVKLCHVNENNVNENNANENNVKKNNVNRVCDL